MLTLSTIGRIGRDAETRSTERGKVANFTVATRGKSKDDTVWIRCAVWGERAGKLAPHLTKGSVVFVSGEAQVRIYEGKAQIDLNVHSLEFGGGSKPKSETKSEGGKKPADDFPEGW